MTPKEAAQLLATAELGGCKPPANLGTHFEIAAALYAGIFTDAGLDAPTAVVALAAYLAEPNRDGYPKPWPDPGAILARTPGARARSALAARAPDVCTFTLLARGSIGGVLDEVGYEPLFRHLERHLGPLPEDAKDALETAIDATGGWRRMGLVTDTDRDYRTRFADAFRRALEGHVVRHALPAPPTRARLP